METLKRAFPDLPDQRTVGLWTENLIA